MAKPTQYPLFAVGAVSVLVFSNLQETDENVHDLTNSANIIDGTNHPVPFMLFSNNVKTDAVVSAFDAVSQFVKAIDIRTSLDFSRFDKVGNPTAWRSNETMTETFFKRINGPELASERKLIYKAMSHPTALLNIDGLLFKVKRSVGDIKISLDMSVTGRVLYSSMKLSGHHWLFHQKYWSGDINQVFNRNPDILSVKRCYWPDFLKTRNIEEYSGYRPKKQSNQVEQTS